MKTGHFCRKCREKHNLCVLRIKFWENLLMRTIRKLCRPVLQTLCDLHKMYNPVNDFHGVSTHLVCSFTKQVILHWVGDFTRYIRILPQCIILRGDLLRSVPSPIFEKNSDFLLFDVYSYVFHWLVGSMWWKNTFPGSAIFLSIFFPYLHVSCPAMIIDIFSESYEVGMLKK